VSEDLAPTDALMPNGAQIGLTVACGLIALAVGVYVVIASRRRGDLAPLLIYVGAGLAVFYEPLGDSLSQVYYPEIGQWSWINSFGRDIPVFIGLLYFWYMAAGSLWLLHKADVGVTARQWWGAWGGYLGFAIALEMVAARGLSNADGAPWIYYGNQAFVFMDVPFFTPWSYVSIDVVVAMGAVMLVRFLPRTQYWLLLPLVPMLMLAGHLMAAWPSVLAMHSTDRELLLQLGGLGTGAFAVLLSYLGSMLFREPWAPPTALAE